MNLVICKPSLSVQNVPFEKVLAPETGAGVEGRALLRKMAAKTPLLKKRDSMEKMILKMSCKNAKVFIPRASCKSAFWARKPKQQKLKRPGSAWLMLR